MDATTLTSLYEGQEKQLKRSIYYLVSCNQEVTEVIYQETFVSFLKYLRKGGRIEYPKAWLKKTATLLALDHQRHEKIVREKFQLVSLSDDELSESRGDIPVISVPGHEERVCKIEWLLEALKKCPPQYRTCVLLQDLEGYSQREIAEFLRISENAVSSNVSRGRAWLRKELNAKEGEQKQ